MSERPTEVEHLRQLVLFRELGGCEVWEGGRGEGRGGDVVLELRVGNGRVCEGGRRGGGGGGGGE